MMIRRQSLCFGTLCLFALVASSNAFSTPIVSKLPTSSSSSRSSSSSVLFESKQQKQQQKQQEGAQDDTTTSTIWLPQLRRVMGGVATAGALETGYLTFHKLFQSDSPVPLCGVDGGCNDILNGPYSYVPFTEIPLSALGFLAYCTVAGLALFPLLAVNNSNNNKGDESEYECKDDTSNRVALLAVTTTMGTFSIFLMTLLFGVLQTTCPYCVFSAACSIILAFLAWIGGCLPDDANNNKNGIRLASTGFLASTVTAVLLFVSGTVPQLGDINNNASPAGSAWGDSGTLLASTVSGGGGGIPTTQKSPLLAPLPATESSKEAMALAATLEGMNAKMYGAYWCSHCYDQKEVFGKQAFAKIEYVECSKDGVNSKTKLCRAMEVPGYPTWEIQGKLYPGQQELDELQDLVKKIKAETK
jgi:uncharacterized membrane protein